MVVVFEHLKSCTSRNSGIINCSAVDHRFRFDGNFDKTTTYVRFFSTLTPCFSCGYGSMTQHQWDASGRSQQEWGCGFFFLWGNVLWNNCQWCTRLAGGQIRDHHDGITLGRQLAIAGFRPLHNQRHWHGTLMPTEKLSLLYGITPYIGQNVYQEYKQFFLCVSQVLVG